MPDVPVTPVPWFDAKDNPPEEERLVVTDLGPMAHFDNVWHDRHAWHMTGDPQPSVWCDPSPPDMSEPLGPLTVEDLRGLDDAFNALIADDDEHIAAYGPMLARLRRALERMNID